MRVTILAHGSRGDVQPYLALGLGLARAGWQVRLAAPEMFRGMVESAGAERGQPGLAFAPLPGDPAALMRRAAQIGRGLGRVFPAPVRSALAVVEYAAPVAAALAAAVADACCDADLVIHSLLTTVLGHLAARRRGVPDISALVFPVFLQTTEFPNPLFPNWAWGPRYNFLSHQEFNRAFFLGNRLGISWLRRKGVDVPPLECWPFIPQKGIPSAACWLRPTPLLYGISPAMLPQPADWPAAGRMTGVWFLDAPEDYRPPEGLLRFLESGPPPVVVGFGSLIPRDADRLARTALAALEAAGQRGVLLGGWSGLNARGLPPWAYPLEEVPFDWLFPRAAAAVHHGGIGTTAAALRAGIPSVTVPFAFDQPFWGQQVRRLGAGPAPISGRGLTARRLSAAVQAVVDDPALRQNAAQVGAQMQAEDGVACAVRAISAWLEQGGRTDC